MDGRSRLDGLEPEFLGDVGDETEFRHQVLEVPGLESARFCRHAGTVSTDRQKSRRCPNRLSTYAPSTMRKSRSAPVPRA